MNTIYSIYKEYIQLILGDIKNLEFRTHIGKDLQVGDTIYLYETKRNHGAGAVVGSVKVKNIFKLKYHKVGTYNMLPFYVQKFGTDEEKAVVQNALSIHLSEYDDSIILNYLYNDKMLNYMKKHDEVPDPFNYPAYHGYTAEEYEERMKKSTKLCEACDAWLTKIGYYNENGNSHWNYAIELVEPIRFDDARAISEFKGKNGEKLVRPPQSWCYTLS